jgi:hypothetical protein
MLIPRKTDVAEEELIVGEHYLVTDDEDGGVGAYQGLITYYGQAYRLFVKPSGRWLLAGKNAIMELLEKR